MEALFCPNLIFNKSTQIQSTQFNFLIFISIYNMKELETRIKTQIAMTQISSSSYQSLKIAHNLTTQTDSARYIRFRADGDFRYIIVQRAAYM